MSSSQRGQLLIISSPSGAGKSTLCARLRAEFGGLGYSISYTTRAPRGSERDGVEYHFVTNERFAEMEIAGDFVESALVHGNRYGTAAATVSLALQAGRELLFDIDYQGAFALKSRFAEDVALVFIAPPTMAELERRLRGRGTDDESTIRRRLAMARAEIGHYAQYDYVVVNDELESAYAALRAIYVATKHRVGRRHEQIAALLADPATCDEAASG